MTLCLDWLIDSNAILKITKWIFTFVSSAKNELRLQHFNHIIPYKCKRVLLVIHIHTHVCVHFSICIMQMIFVCFGHFITHEQMISLHCSRLWATMDGWFGTGKTAFICFEVYTVWTINVVNVLFVKATTFQAQRLGNWLNSIRWKS